MSEPTRPAAPLLPVALRLSGRRCLVVGGGEIAARKAHELLECGARVVVVSPEWRADFAGLEDTAATAPVGHLTLRTRPFRRADLRGVFVAFAATDDPAVQETVWEEAERRGVLCNVVDVPSRCHFFVPAILRRGPLAIAVTTSGRSPLLAARVRDWIGERISDRAGVAVEALHRARRLVRALHPREIHRRREALLRLHGPEVIEDVLAGRLDALEARRRAWWTGERRRAARPDAAERAESQTGSVSLVGAGPGDPGLLTLRAVERLRAAEVVFHDALVSEAILAFVPSSARRVSVGKRRGAAAMTQQDIEAALVREAQAGRTVVRLKGGDPFVFGRGGEEALALAGAGVPFEVVPGVSSGIAGPALAGIPLTHRGLASSAAFLTAHDLSADEGATVRRRLRRLARGAETLVLFMAGSELSGVKSVLLAAGTSPRLPAALIESASTPEQKVWTGTLDRIDRLFGEPGVPARAGGPLLAVLGPTVALAARLSQEVRIPPDSVPRPGRQSGGPS